MEDDFSSANKYSEEQLKKKPKDEQFHWGRNYR